MQWATENRMRDPIAIPERERAAVGIRPSGDKVLGMIEPVLHQSSGGILLGPAQIELDEYEIVRVLAIGEGAVTKKGAVVPPGYDPAERPNGYERGDRVCIWRGHGTTVSQCSGAEWGYDEECRVVLLRTNQIVPALLPEGELRIRHRKDKRDE